MVQPKINISLDSAETSKVEQTAFGGGFEGAERISRETARWVPSMLSPDQIVNGVKQMADARGADMVRNDGYTRGAVTVYQDSIVGGYYRLNAQPNWRVLGADEAWAEEFQKYVEARFNLIAESIHHWLDAAGRCTLTDLVRLGVSSFVITGEVLATAEWMREGNRPIRTAVQLTSPDRLSNPDGISDDRHWRRGVYRNFWGKPTKYAFRMAHPTEGYDANSYRWRIVNAEKPWGRKQVIHIVEQLMPDQSRGIADMVSVLKQMKMTKNFQEITLQNAVINASFAAAIESELPPQVLYEQMGGAAEGYTQAINAYMGQLAEFLQSSTTIQIDGAKIPHLFPGTKLNMQPMGQPGGVGTDFEESLLRNIAAGLGLSYEEFSKDFSKTNYSSARASMTATWRHMQSRKKNVADRLATEIYALWLEEEINAGNIPLPKGKTSAHFYEPLMKEAYTACSWIGASRGQIDELKETQAAILRIKSGLSTYELETSRLGLDFREVFEQRAREEKLIKDKGLVFALDAQRDKSADGQRTMTDNRQGNNSSEDEE